VLPKLFGSNAGRIWSSAGDGVHCLDPDGTLLGKILVPETVANVVFGGLKRNDLFMCATASVYTIRVSATGAALLRIWSAVLASL
jgi:gluconolactonase